MALQLEPEVSERIPLSYSEQRVVLIEGTRVPLDIVVNAFNNGKSAEEIVLSFSTLRLADVNAVLAFYLRHRDDVDAYVMEGRNEADLLRRRIESDFDPQGIRERLLARQENRNPLT